MHTHTHTHTRTRTRARAHAHAHAHTHTHTQTHTHTNTQTHTHTHTHTPSLHFSTRVYQCLRHTGVSIDARQVEGRVPILIFIRYGVMAVADQLTDNTVKV